ncbi:MAG: gephyrin-like molybdotransferase Glp [Thermocrinis sp.]|jgi:molybdopterin molybdotransferase|uniref:molybdopterin molybdotransferase MoeA n=1 Tax=Thermocrinis sp. TaxID=2024383 RepID=UPI003BFC2ADF
MMPYEEALSIVLSHCSTLPTERVYLLDALGRVLAEDVISEEDRPSFDNSAMDGYAVHWEDIKDAPVELLVAGEIPAGAEETFELPKGCAIKIFTGAPIPKGATAVVPVEYTEAKDGKVLIKEAFKEGANIRRKGEELKAGEVVLQKGTILRHYEVGLLASLNKVQVEVSRRPRVAVLSTGDEIKDLGEPITKPSQIRTSNGYTLMAGISLAGGEPHYLGIVPDEPDRLKKALSQLEDYDVFITTGGVSMGDRDYIKTLVEEVGVKVHFHKVRIKPAKPILFGTYKEGKGLFFGIPGNPVSCAMAFDLIVKPALLKMQSAKDYTPKTLWAKLKRDFSRRDPERREFVRAILSLEGQQLVCDFSQKLQSHMLTSYVGANCYMVVREGVKELKGGELVEVVLF